MKMRNITWVALSCLAVFLFAMPLQAGDLTVFVGGVIPGSIEYKDADISLDNGPVYGVRLATSFVPHFGMEHTLAFSSDYLFPSSLQEINEAKGFIYNSNFIFNIPLGKVVPYLTVGAGLIHQYGDSDLPVGTEFAFNYGGGLKFPRMIGPLGLRFDMRGYRAGAVSNALHILEMSGGVMISFGK
jgi:hypothetical protein